MGEEPQQTSWHLPKSLLTRYSTFFAAALNVALGEADIASVTLSSQVKPSVFELFVQWLYMGEYKKEEKGFKHHDEAWVLGEFLGCAAFQDFAILNMILYHRTTFVTKPQVLFAYHQSPPKSKLRQFLVTQYVSDRVTPKESAFEAWALEEHEQEVTDFIADVGRLTATRVSQGFEDPYNHPLQFLQSTNPGVDSASEAETSRRG